MSETGFMDVTQEYKVEQDYKRELNHKHKWALGVNPATPGHPSKRPAKVSRSPYAPSNSY